MYIICIENKGNRNTEPAKQGKKKMSSFAKGFEVTEESSLFPFMCLSFGEFTAEDLEEVKAEIASMFMEG